MGKRLKADLARLRGKLKRQRASYWPRRREVSRIAKNIRATKAKIKRRKSQIGALADQPRRALGWALQQVGTTESPPGSNRGGKITTWQRQLGAWLVGLAWCGVFVANALIHAGVKGVNFRLASVANIEDDAKAGSGPFRAWTTDPAKARPGDVVVLFGRGVHVGLVEKITGSVVTTVEGNTSFGSAGSQSNGGAVARRTRPLADVHGFALVNYAEAA